MEEFQLNQAEGFPKIYLDENAGVFEISGSSYFEDVKEVYFPVLECLEEYKNSPNPETCFTFQFDYFNTASSKMILDVLMKLEEIHNCGSKTTVYWYYPHDDNDMKDAGRQYAEMVKVPFEFVGYDD
jgi:hypothetical protein